MFLTEQSTPALWAVMKQKTEEKSKKEESKKAKKEVKKETVKEVKKEESIVLML